MGCTCTVCTFTRTGDFSPTFRSLHPTSPTTTDAMITYFFIFFSYLIILIDSAAKVRNSARTAVFRNISIAFHSSFASGREEEWNTIGEV